MARAGIQVEAELEPAQIIFPASLVGSIRRPIRMARAGIQVEAELEPYRLRAPS